MQSRADRSIWEVISNTSWQINSPEIFSWPPVIRGELPKIVQPA
jgi:hypothetical protein